MTFKDPGEGEDASLSEPWPTVIYAGSADWQIQRPSTSDDVTEAYTDAPSYLPGDTLRLAVSTDAPTYLVEIFRIGATVQSVARSEPQKGIRQPKAVVEPGTKLVSAPWRYTYSRRIPANWPSGVYLARITGTGGTQTYAPFVIRSPLPSQLLFVSNALNDQAYNRWGGSSLYWTGIGAPAPGEEWAFAVSLDRPYHQEDGAGQLFSMEAPLIAWLEHNGYDVTYTTDYDLSLHPDDQPLPATVLFSGHSEYWGAALRNWLDQHVVVCGDFGLGVFAADTGYWQVRFRDDSPTGPRTVELYKHGTLDPTAVARCGDGLRPGANTFRREPCGLVDIRNRPEQTLFGVQYGAIARATVPYQLARGATALLAGTGLHPGDSLGEIAGGEVDNVDSGYPQPDGNTIVASATAHMRESGHHVPVEAVMHRTAGGGAVFASGTFWWAWGLEPTYAAANDVPAGFDQLMRNILAFLTTP